LLEEVGCRMQDAGCRMQDAVLPLQPPQSLRDSSPSKWGRSEKGRRWSPDWSLEGEVGWVERSKFG